VVLLFICHGEWCVYHTISMLNNITSHIIVHRLSYTLQQLKILKSILDMDY